MLVDYLSGSPPALPTSSQEPPRNAAQFAHLSPLNFKNTFAFALFGLRNPRGNTNAPQKIINFCHFSALFALFRGYLGATIVQSCPDGSGAPSVPECSRCCQPIRNGSPQGKRERKKGKAKKRSDNKPTSPQKEGTPPYCKEQAVIPPHHKFAPKNQQKVALG